MIIGVPKEIKANENRVALLPVGAQMLIKNNHKVVVETNAGVGSGFSDNDYKAVGAEIAKGPEEIFKTADMIMKVKEPINNEYNMIREGQIVFTYFHFAASKELTEAMTLKQLGLFKGPIVILNTLDFYGSLINFLDQMVAKNFLRTEHKGIWEIAPTPPDVITAILNNRKWIDNPRKIAKI